MDFTTETLKHVACEAIDNFIPSLNDLSQDIWSHPELAFHEHHAHNALTSFLEESVGFSEVRRSYLLETGFRAMHGDASKPNVAVICEYDALPEIGHACGHNLIAEVGVAAGIGIKAAIDWTSQRGHALGIVTVLGTPAEEAGGGKVRMINGGAFKSIDVAMMSHPAPCTTSTSSQFIASRPLFVKYFGKASHAAAYPWRGNNALDAAVMAYINISTMRQQLKPTWLVHGIIVNGGTTGGTIPKEAALEYFIRAPCLSELNALQAKAICCFEAAAKAAECEVEINSGRRGYLNVVTNPTLAGLYESNAVDVGVKFDQDPTTNAMTASTDMGNVSYEVPSIHPLYNISSSAGNHTVDFNLSSGDRKAQPHTIAQGKALAMTAIDIYCQPDLINKMRDEHLKQLALQ